MLPEPNHPPPPGPRLDLHWQGQPTDPDALRWIHAIVADAPKAFIAGAVFVFSVALLALIVFTGLIGIGLIN